MATERVLDVPESSFQGVTYKIVDKLNKHPMLRRSYIAACSIDLVQGIEQIGKDNPDAYKLIISSAILATPIIMCLVYRSKTQTP